MTTVNPHSLIAEYITRTSGLELRGAEAGELVIFQRIDSKTIRFPVQTIEEVLERIDADGKNFLQVNFLDGRKILLTEKLVGFKPVQMKGLDLKKLPKVVTTPDLVSVVEALEESLSANDPRDDEVEVLRRVFEAVLAGALAVGFEVEAEKSWANSFHNFRRRPSA